LTAAPTERRFPVVTESKVFGVIAAFLLVATGVYALWDHLTQHRVDAAGTVVFGLSGVLSLVYASYFWLVARRIPPRPEDRGDAEVAEGAGPIGNFAPAALWPVGIAGSAGLAALGVAMSQLWLLGVGLVALLATVAGLVFEFYAGAARS
jgi:Cytochrome c oxidase subunit IV